MTYRDLPIDALARIAEVNRAERVEIEYLVRPDGSGFGLVAERVVRDPPVEIPPWSPEGAERRVREWRPALEGGGALRGAFDSDALVGFVLLGPTRSDGSAEVVALFVDRDHRRRGIADALMDWVEAQAPARGIGALYLAANPTGSSVGFYLARGFEVVGLTSKVVVPSLPGDILMAKRLPAPPGDIFGDPAPSGGSRP